MGTLLKFFVLWVGCCFMACSTQRHRQSEVNQRREERILDFRAMSVEQLDSLSVAQVHQVYQQQDAVAIVPVGRFSYHPGSGFSGEAEKVVIFGKRNTIYDSLQNKHHRYTLRERQKLRDSSHTRESQRYRTKTVEHTGTPGWRWWLIVIAVIALMILARVLRKRPRLWKLLGFLFSDKPK
ncbi:hypothetical protein [Sinomicrobium weinanense]|uniref:Uncharacterized protein n=1 Tax=Sinomicrobium weinanense TaxID=2842200 RepID=A0A926JQ10_9FLAO|nr:hypothetical protein [Sinomicrobium weinanense]MBC9795141.1 hypothetical protein [Sinomicrobium weinanense]MBU3123727.1 hypothetical protein [Sinomicrobium weinanense]